MSSQPQDPDSRTLLAGDPAPWFAQRSTSNEVHPLDTAGGRWLVLCFFGSAADPVGRAALGAIAACRRYFDDDFASFFGVSNDPADESGGRVAESLPGVRFFWDFDARASAAFGIVPASTDPPAGTIAADRKWFILDPMLRIHRVLPLAGEDGGVAALAAALAGLPPVARYSGAEQHAPVLVLPGVFDAEFCARLIALYESHGGRESGFMRERDGRTVVVTDPAQKRRSDHLLKDESAISTVHRCIERRVVPEIRKVFQFDVTRMERLLIGCYDAATSGHFRVHRDNTTRGTAHRRFAVSIGLNDSFEGGELMFPEFGPGRYRTSTGTAIVFSCSLLHLVQPVTAGRRFVFLPFLYDHAAARQREANNPHLDRGIGRYRATRRPED
jgi:peroxiredoxin/predicted 2-oxoglutarate/Fe(II)-dependent dioxygenase YbiX